MRRAGALSALVCAAGLAASSATPAYAASYGRVLEQADAAELSASLKEAQDVQHICYGWYVTVDDQNGGPDLRDSGSSQNGPTLGLVGDGTDGCDRNVTFRASITWTSESGESEDFASWEVISDLSALSGNPSSVRVSTSNLIANPDDEVVRAVSELPAAAAEAGLAPWMPVEVNTEPLAQGDGITGAPGSDWLRKWGSALLVLGLVLIGALIWAGKSAWDLAQDRKQRDRDVASRSEVGEDVVEHEVVPSDGAAPSSSEVEENERGPGAGAPDRRTEEGEEA